MNGVLLPDNRGEDGGGSIPVPITPSGGGTGTTTVFTQGSIIFAGAAGVYSQDNGAFYWNDTTKAMGIGISSPTSTFDLRQVAQTSGTQNVLHVLAAANTGRTSATEVIGNFFDNSATQTWNAGEVAIQRETFFAAPTYAGNSASIIDIAISALVGGPPIAGVNMTIGEVVGFVAGDVFNNVYSSDKADAFIAVIPGISDGTGHVTRRVGLAFFSTTNGTIHMGNQTAILDQFYAVDIGSSTLVSTTNTRTITDAVGLYVEGPPTNGGNVVFTNPVLAFKVAAGNSQFNGRILGANGTTAAANTITLPNANQFSISGNTQINAIITSGWTAGTSITLIFQSGLTVKHNTAGSAGSATILLAGSIDFNVTFNTRLVLEYTGTNWVETSRTVS